MTNRYQNQISLKNCNALIANLKRLYANEKEIPENLKNIHIFNENELEIKKKTIRNYKFKSNNNFKNLMIY